VEGHGEGGRREIEARRIEMTEIDSSGLAIGRYRSRRRCSSRHRSGLRACLPLPTRCLWLIEGWR
jgi:hypothetical protein